MPRILFMMSRFLIFLFFASTLLSLPALAKRATQGFKLAKVETRLRSGSDLPPDPSVLSILKQRFSYLGKGAQCYVFESEDRRFVIKLFRSAEGEKGETLYQACQIASEHLQKETALLYLHLHRSVGLGELKCTDPIGRTVRVPLNEVSFAIQKKGEPFFDSFKRAKGDSSLMKGQIDGFISLLITRAQRGVLNTDRSLGANFGFIDGEAVEFDFGNYRLVPGLDCQQEVRRYTSQLEEWLSIHAPEWSSYLTHRIEELL